MLRPFDNILSKVINKRGNIYKVINYNESKISYVVKEDEVTAHGKTIRECYDSLIYKRKDKDTSLYKTWKSSDIKTKEELIKAYRTITGACEYGVKSFCEKIELPKECSVEKAIEITCGHYGNNKFKDFFKE